MSAENENAAKKTRPDADGAAAEGVEEAVEEEVFDDMADDTADDAAEETAEETAADPEEVEPEDSEPEDSEPDETESEESEPDETEIEAGDTEDSEAESHEAEDNEAESHEAEAEPGADAAAADEPAETVAPEEAEEAEEPEAAAATETEARNRRTRGAHARRVTPRQRLRALVAPQANKTQAVIALACLVLGFGLSVQVQSTSSASSFSSLRQSELVSLLDRLTNRQDHLRREISRLQQEKTALQSDNSGAARRAAQDRQDTLGILAGTEPATGPGIELTVTDPHRAINAADLLNAIEELRDSGAEVLQIGNVRIGADTYFLDTKGGVIVDGEVLRPSYRVLAIGEPHTMSTAMNIPGGVLDSLHRSGAEGTVKESQSLSITAVRKP